MGIHGAIKQTLEVSTGDVATVNDAFDSAKLDNGAKNPLGTSHYEVDSSDRPLKYRYVQWDPTAADTPVAGGPVYWKDDTMTIVTGHSSESVAGLNGIAGILLNAGVTDTNFCFIQVGGFHTAVVAPASIVAGDHGIGATGEQLVTRVADGATAPVQDPFVTYTGAVAAGVADGFVHSPLESSL